MEAITRSDLFNVWINSNPQDRKSVVWQYIKKKAGVTDINSKQKQVIIKYCSTVQDKWNLSKRNIKFFLTRYKTWLCGNVFAKPGQSRKQQNKKTFDELTDRSKRRRVAEFKEGKSAAELAFAAQMNARNEGNEDAAKLLKETLHSPKRSTRIRRAWKHESTSGSKRPRKLTDKEALSFYIDGNFTKSLWIKMRQNNKMCNVLQIYPSYAAMMKAREKYMPSREFIKITELSAEVQLQALLDHTTKQIVVQQDEVLARLTDAELKNLELVVKWGFDGCSGQSNYKQSATGEQFDDSTIFITSLVPVQMRVRGCPSKVVWHNLRSSSTRFCRPIRMQFAKETRELTLREKQNVDDQIAALRPTVAETEFCKEMSVMHTLVCSMVDGKVCSAISEVSCQKCYVCEASPKEFNDVNKMLQRTPNKEMLKFGMSPLHCHIRFMECLLHVSYRIDVKCWQARKPHEKESVTTRKRKIQEEFKTKTGLIIDVPKQGSGTFNDGNTARRFFQNPALTASITGLDVDLIENFATILTVISSGFEIDADKFDYFGIETAKLFVKLYGWYKMPSSVHRVLLHGADIIRVSTIPVGTLSEEPQECRNKDIKIFREYRSRKCSRVATNQDIFYRLMLSSDPIISSIRKILKRKSVPFNEKVLKFLKEPNIAGCKVTYASDEDVEENSEIDELC